MNQIRLIGGIVVCAVLLTGCGVQGLNFVKDDRVDIVAPEDRAEVELPVTVRWTVEDFELKDQVEAAGEGGYFAVFVDRAPQPPGKTVEWFARDDRVCENTPGCPDADYLAERGIYVTTNTSFRIDELPDLTRGERRDFHEVTIVLLDSQGQRIGESAFTVEFQVKRNGR